MGKSTVAVQLALAHQLAGHKVLSLGKKMLIYLTCIEL